MFARNFKKLLKFRLRTLFAIITAAALFLGLWVSWIAPARHEAEIVRRIKVLGGQVVYVDRFEFPIRNWLSSSVPIDYVASVVSVDLSHTQPGDADLRMLTHLPHLKALSLEGATIREDSTGALRDLQPLQRLNLADTGVSSTVLATLRHLPNLRHLDLRRTSALSHSREMAAGDPWAKQYRDRGQTVWISAPLAVGISDLAEMGNLETLNLTDTEVNDADLKELASLRNLRVLSIANLAISDVGVRELRNLPSLRELVLDDSSVTGRGLNELRGLERLSLRGCHEVSDATLDELGEVTSLQELDLSDTGYRDEGGHAVQQPAQFFSGSRVERVAFRVLGFPYEDPRPSVVTDAGLERLHGLQHLSLLNLHGTDAAEAGKQRLKAALPYLKIAE